MSPGHVSHLPLLAAAVQQMGLEEPLLGTGPRARREERSPVGAPPARRGQKGRAHPQPGKTEAPARSARCPVGTHRRALE